MNFLKESSQKHIQMEGEIRSSLQMTTVWFLTKNVKKH